MNRTPQPPVGLILGSCLLLAPLAGAASLSLNLNERDYSVIVDRNPFGLRAPPPPATNVVTTPQPKDELLLTGITSIGAERAYFMTKARPGQTPEYYALGAGEAKNTVEVIDIDPVAKAVRVRYAGVETLMTFQENGVKPPPPAPAVNRRTATMAPRTASAISRMVTTRPTTPGSAVRRIPTRTVRTTPTVNVSSSLAPGTTKPDTVRRGAVRPYAAEQDVLLMELQKVANPQVKFPPTPVPGTWQ